MPLDPAYIGSLWLEELRGLRNRVRCTWLRHESLHFVTIRNRALLREARVTVVRRRTACGGGFAALAAGQQKTTALAVVLIFGEAEEVVGGAFEDLAEGFDIFVADGFGLVVDHATEILIAHPQLVVEPVFRLSLFLQQGQNI